MGAPGAGKTTYCDGMQQYLRLLGRECLVVNLDPANEVPYPTASGDDNEPEKGGDCGDAKLDDQGNNEESGNAQLPYETVLDVCEDIISLDAVMQELQLGPNGGLLYCMEYIEHHLLEVMNLLKERLNMQDGQKSGESDRPYLLFDLPGQVELTAHSNVVSRIAQRLVRELDMRLVCVQLVDAAVCLTDVAKFIGAALVCTSSMMRIELPCVNVLSKMDLLQASTGIDTSRVGQSDGSDEDDFEYADSAQLPFNLEFFTQCHDLHRLVDYLDSSPLDLMNHSHDEVDEFDYTEDPEYQKAQQKTRSTNFFRKYHKLHHELCDLVEDYGLLSFLPLSIQDAESVGRVLARIDKCNGYVFLRDANAMAKKSDKSNMQDMFSSAMVADSEWGAGVLADVQERYLGNSMFREDIAELKTNAKDQKR